MRDGRHPFGDSNMSRTLQNIAEGEPEEATSLAELPDDSLETVERLLAQGADVEEKDESGLTILQYVVENPSKQSIDMIQILDKHCANLREEGF